MRIAGLTWWRGNYGSILQAYALQEVLNSIDGVEYEIINQYGEMLSASNLMDKMKRMGIKKIVQRIRWKYASYGLLARSKSLEDFTDTRLKLSSGTYTPKSIHKANSIYDGFICGSDQIWNPLLSSLDDIYWLTFADKGKPKIAYAPSIGVTETTPDQEVKIRNNLSTFTAISCREEVGTKLFNSILGGKQTCKTVLDPTLLLPKEEWDLICPDRLIVEPYVFAYILRSNKEQRVLVEQFGRKHHLKVVTFPYLDSEYIEKYDAKFGDVKIYDASPTDFISWIRNAEYVFSDSFHCSIFSILYHRNFFMITKVGKSQLTRLSDLQQKFGIKGRIISEAIPIDYMDRVAEIDWLRVDELLRKLRTDSYEYLNSALGRKE